MNISSTKLALGQHVHCILYGGNDGIIVGIKGEQSPTTCKTLHGGVAVTGGSAQFEIVWDNDTRSLVPESLVRGSVQWRVSDEVASADEVAQAKARFFLAEVQRKVKAEEQALAFRNAVKDIQQQHPDLNTTEADHQKRAIKNLRILLKKHFPSVKFSVRKDSCSAIYVRWNDGPTESQVTSISDKFRAGTFCGMSDMYESSDTPWNTTFGSAQYIFASRDVSTALISKAIDDLWVLLPGNLKGIEKPTSDTVFSKYIPIPDIGDCICDLVRVLAYNYDAFKNEYQNHASGRGYYILRYARRYYGLEAE